MNARFRPHLLFFFISISAAWVMISHQSLWIDENQTAGYARQPNLREWAQVMIRLKKSETLMPLGMFVAWLGGRLLGTGEWELRAVNLLWTAGAGLAMGLIGRQLKLPWLLLVFLVHPFVWYCTNEARPYALQICAGAWLLYGIILLATEPKDSNRAAWVLTLATVTGFGSSLMFAFALAAAAATIGLILYRSERASLRLFTVAVPAAVALAFLGLSGAYYLWALRQGAAGARIWQVSPLNLGFAFYELLGFSGLGPPRNELRELVRGGDSLHLFLRQCHLPGLIALALTCFAAIGKCWLARRDRMIQLLTLFLSAYGSLIFLVCLIMRFPFWGRHMAPALPFVVLLIVRLLSPRAENPWLTEKLVFWLFLICLTASSLILRYAPAYGKDDYRSACASAERALAAGKTVWWSADPETSAYYGLSEDKQAHRNFFLCYEQTSESLARLPAPDLIVRSKPDIHDRFGVIQNYLEGHGFVLVHRFPAFTVWARRGATVEPGWFGGDGMQEAGHSGKTVAQSQDSRPRGKRAKASRTAHFAHP